MNKAEDDGFTLIELLVALVIFSLAAMMLLQAATGSLRQTHAREAQRELQLYLDAIWQETIVMGRPPQSPDLPENVRYSASILDGTQAGEFGLLADEEVIQLWELRLEHPEGASAIITGFLRPKFP